MICLFFPVWGMMRKSFSQGFVQWNAIAQSPKPWSPSSSASGIWLTVFKRLNFFHTTRSTHQNTEEAVWHANTIQRPTLQAVQWKAFVFEIDINTNRLRKWANGLAERFHFTSGMVRGRKYSWLYHYPQICWTTVSEQTISLAFQRCCLAG